MKHFLATATALALFCGCEKTEECDKLEKLMLEHKNLQTQAEGYAKRVPAMEKRVAKLEEEATVYKKETGLGRPESALHKELAGRLSQVKGATMTRSVEEFVDGKAIIKETVWRIQFPARGFFKAFETSQKIAAVPPLFTYRRLTNAKKGLFEMELVRPRLLETDLSKVESIELPRLGKADDIPSQLGFCGASDLRASIAESAKKIEAVRKQAESVSRLLPLGSSWQGVLGRAQRLVKIEEANRDIIGRFVDMSAKAKLTPVEVGATGEDVVLSVAQGKKHRGRLDRAAAPEFLDAMSYVDDTKAKLLRVIVKNPFSAARAPTRPH